MAAHLRADGSELLKRRRGPIRVAARPAFSNSAENPYNSLLYRAASAAGGVRVLEHTFAMPPWRCDVFHVHWPELYVSPRSARPADVLRSLVFWAWLLLARAAGVKIVWTAHNTYLHDKVPTGLSLFLWRRFLASVDGVIFPSEESHAIVTAAYPRLGRLPSALIKLGHYLPWIDSVRATAARPAREVEAALRGLGSAFVVLNFGSLRRYKNVDELVRRFSAFDDPDVRLLVAGHVPDPDYRTELETLAKADPRVVLLPGHLDDASLVACLDRADLVVLPFRKILNSSSALTAMSFGKHVVVPAIGAMRSLQRDVGAGALTVFDGPFDAGTLRRAVDRVRTKNVAPADLNEYEWPLLGARTAEFYARLVPRRLSLQVRSPR